MQTKPAPGGTELSTSVNAVDTFFASTADGKKLALSTADRSKGVTEVMGQVAEREIGHEEETEKVTWAPEPGDSSKVVGNKLNVRAWMVRIRRYAHTDGLAKAALYSKAGQLLEMTHEGGYVDVSGEYHSTKEIFRDYEKTFGEGKQKTSGRWRSIHAFVEKQVDWLEDTLGIESALILGVIREDATVNIAEVHGWIQRVRKWTKDEEDLRVTPDTLKEEVEWILKKAAVAENRQKFVKDVKEHYASPEQGENGGVGEIPYSIHEMGTRRRIVMEMTEEQWDEFVRPSLSSALTLDRDVGYEPIPIEMLTRLGDPRTQDEACRQVIKIKLLSEYDTAFVLRMLETHADEWLSISDFEVFFPGEAELSRTEIREALDKLFMCRVTKIGTDEDGVLTWKMEETGALRKLEPV